MSEVYIICPYRKFMRQRLGRIHNRQAAYATYPLASGMTRPFVGTKDIVMINSVCDVLGLNTVTRRVFQNGALALAGMAYGYKPSEASGKPLVVISTLRGCRKIT